MKNVDLQNDHETNKSLVERQSNVEKADEEMESQLLPALQFDDITHAVPVNSFAKFEIKIFDI